MMIRLLLIILLLAAAMWLGPLVLAEPGYVRIVLAGYTLEMTVVGLVVLVLVSGLLLWLTAKLLRALWRLPSRSWRFWQWRRRQKAEQAFQEGLRAFARQQWQDAANLLQQSLAHSQYQDEKRMLAGYAAFYAGQTPQAEQLIQQLAAEDPNTWFVQADLLIQQGQAAQAAHLLQAKVDQQPKACGLGQLYLFSLQQAGQWQQLLEQVPAALKHRWFSKSQWAVQRYQIYPKAISSLVQSGQFSEQAEYWQALPGRERKSVAAVIGRAWAKANQGQTEQAERLLVNTLALADIELAWPYLRQIPLGKSVLQLRKQVQHWLRDHAGNGYLYALLSWLAEQEGELEQARLAWKKALQYQPELAASKR
ncbi:MULTISPECIES: heme biosynthesis protein HemY [Alkalimonas]|uniref:Heme biosynthesis HemY N-terminal domain-containing protein n=1 Tax=Alkalimonas mucilaginosa TaxID=3057676 RepID=A0ABU7JIG2_9GAMM|nr:heme biosynthesis HemY N-terminal domain-containing protein [Alkalimonas sp. MEB004]MEE2025464.1 heme biosynthesis HemY N-terminal domain-containing protein [Alkalimonas sp. MEB004]